MVRRIITIDGENDKSYALADEDLQSPLLDLARPGFFRQKIWMTDSSPAKIQDVSWVDAAPELLEPLAGGSIFHIYQFPPDKIWRENINPRKIAEYFKSSNAEHLIHQSEGAHPYMQKTDTLDLCVILKGSITLILDTTEVDLHEGDSIVQRATRHAWSNRSLENCTIAISSHCAKQESV
jgi:hypothetical protein